MKIWQWHNGGFAVCMAPEPGAGGGGPTPTPTPEPDDKDKKIAELTAELEKLKAKPNPTPNPKPNPTPDDPDLQARARAEAEAKSKDQARQKSLESALKFDMSLPEFLKQNATLLPKDAGDIVAQANKEKYEDAVAKDRAVKAALMKSYFQVQANLDQLTAYQKSQVENWLTLSNTGREEKASEMFEQVFEPAFDTLRKVKKAEALHKGHHVESGQQGAYKTKMIERSQKHYGVKNARSN